MILSIPENCWLKQAEPMRTATVTWKKTENA